MIETLPQMEKRAVKHLRQSFARGEYVTERATEFWSVRQADDCLAGERKTMGSDLVCLPIRFTGKTLLVCLTDTNGKQWFSWIHP